MSDFNNLKLEVAEEIAVLTISRPAALNALNSETLDELNTALTEIEARDDIKVVILTGGPDKKGNEFKSFVAGADISEMVNFTAAEARAFGMRASVPFFKLMNMRQVTIAAVNGFALGGGCEISMACDIRIASDNATFAQPETGLGIIGRKCNSGARSPRTSDATHLPFWPYSRGCCWKLFRKCLGISPSHTSCASIHLSGAGGAIFFWKSPICTTSVLTSFLNS